MGISDLVRRSCREVSKHAELVRIDDKQLWSYATGLGEQLASAEAGPSATTSADDDPERTAGLVLALATINFGSGYHDVVAKLPGLSGARTMASHLRSVVERRGGVSVGWLQSLTGPACARIFGQSYEHPEQRELADLFAKALRDLGQFVDGGFDGSFASVAEDASGSAERLAGSLRAMPFFNDRAELDGRTVHFYKRAQIAAADLARAFGHLPPARFGDLHRLTCFADNLVPHVLRVDRVLDYDQDLAARIDAGELLEHGSRGEIEIRAAGVEAVERLVAATGPAATKAMDLDLALWSRGAHGRYKAVRRHRSRCVFY